LISEYLQVLPEDKVALSEAQRSLFGSPNGLVFFTPSLTNVSNSTIQVDDVKACTTAYDTYVFPPQGEPKPGLFTFASTSRISKIGVDVLLGSPTKGVDIEVRDLREENVSPVLDSDVSYRLEETYPPERASLLNSPGWVLYKDPMEIGKFAFKTADNSSPMPSPTYSANFYGVNSGEVLSLAEGLTLFHVMGMSLSDTILHTTQEDLNPGENVLQANISETMNITEGITPVVGVIFPQTLVLTEGLSLI
jgi:hypothetical protein